MCNTVPVFITINCVYILHVQPKRHVNLKWVEIYSAFTVLWRINCQKQIKCHSGFYKASYNARFTWRFTFIQSLTAFPFLTIVSLHSTLEAKTQSYVRISFKIATIQSRKYVLTNFACITIDSKNMFFLCHRT